MQRRDVKINGDTFTLTTLSQYGFSVGIRASRQEIDKDHFIIRTVHSIWDKSLYAVAHTPILVDEVANRTKFSKHSELRVLDCPIKFPGSNEYRIPRDLLQFEEVIAKCVSYEHSINANAMQYYAYITVDQGLVEKNHTQRNIGCHADGFQGVRIHPKRPIERSYIVYDKTPPVFYGQKFRTMQLDPMKHNFFSSFDAQANEEDAMTFPEYNIVLSNAYTVHRAATMKELGYRTFFRLSFATTVFDRLGNTHNPLFDYSWNMVTRDTRSKLCHKRLYDENAF